MHRGWFPYPLLRAFTNVIQRDLEVAATIQDLYAGRPAIYTMFLGYDEVAHHSGVERAETLRELTRIDRQLARLARAAADADRAATRSSCSRTTARLRARRSGSATGSRSTSWCRS